MPPPPPPRMVKVVRCRVLCLLCLLLFYLVLMSVPPPCVAAVLRLIIDFSMFPFSGVRGTRMGSTRPSTRTGGEGSPEDAQSAVDLDVSGPLEGAVSTNNNNNNHNNSTP